MGFVSLRSWRARSAALAEASAALKARLVAAFSLGPEDALAVNEVACADPGCPDVETIVLVMRAGEPTRALRVRRPIGAVDADDVAGLVAEERRLRPAGDRGARVPQPVVPPATSS